MTTGLVVLKMVLMPSRHFRASLANSGPRWSMIGVSIARSTRSGSGVGPGICRKWRPTVREEFFDIERSFAGTVLEGQSTTRGRDLPPSRTNARVSQASWRNDLVHQVGKDRSMAETVMPGLERRLKTQLLGDV